MLLLNDAFNSFAFASLLYGTNGQADSCHTAHFVARSWQIPKCSLCCHRNTRKLAEQHLPLSFLTVRQACMATRILKAVKNVIITHAWVTFRPDPTRGPFELINYVGDFEGNGLLKIRLPIREFTLQFASPRLASPFASKFRFALVPVSGFARHGRGRAMSTDMCAGMGTGHGRRQPSDANILLNSKSNQIKLNQAKPSGTEGYCGCLLRLLTHRPAECRDWLTDWLTD